MSADIKWDEDSQSYNDSRLMITRHTENGVPLAEPRIVVFLRYKDEDNDLESEGEVSFEDLMEASFNRYQEAEEQLALAKYFRRLAERLEEAAK